MADFQKHRSEFEEAGIGVVVASVDPEADAKKMIDAEGITYPVGYGLVAEDVARILGSFYAHDDELPFLHPADVIVRPDGTIESATYSTSAIGRLTAADTLALIGLRTKESAKA